METFYESTSLGTIPRKLQAGQAYYDTIAQVATGTFVSDTNVPTVLQYTPASTEQLNLLIEGGQGNLWVFFPTEKVVARIISATPKSLNLDRSVSITVAESAQWIVGNLIGYKGVNIGNAAVLVNPSLPSQYTINPNGTPLDEKQTGRATSAAKYMDVIVYDATASVFEIIERR